MKLFAAGVSYKTAPVELREQLAVKQSAIVDLAFVLKCFGHLDEIVLLSTCNRVEIYGTTRQATGHIKSLLQLLCAEQRDLDPHIYLYEGAAAVRHLLRVAAGLDSIVQSIWRSNAGDKPSALAIVCSKCPMSMLSSRRRAVRNCC